MTISSQASVPTETSCHFDGKWWAILFPLLFLASFSLSGTSIPNSSNIDASWQASIEYAAAHRLQFGKDILFHYGPLGFLTSKFGQGLLPLPRIFSAFALAAITAGFTLSIAKTLNSNTRFLFLLWSITLATYVDMEQNIFFMMACCSLKIIDTRKGVTAIVIIPVFLAFLALIKFTFLLISVIVLLIGIVYLSLKGCRSNAAAISVCFLTSFAALWKITGQEFGNLTSWLRGSLEITSGYVETMSCSPETVSLVLSLCVLSLFIFMLLLSVLKKISSPLECTPLLLVLLFALISWKLGFVRADEEHTSRFFISFPLISVLIIAAASKERVPVSAGRPLYIAVISIMVLCITAFQLQAKGRNFLKLAVLNFTATLETSSGQLLNISRGEYNKCFNDISTGIANEDMSTIRSLVGKDSIDVINSISWHAIGNRLNYTPRPLIQSNAAYTPYLQNLDLSFMKSEKRPEWIVAKMDSIDDKLPVMEDALLFPWIMKNYRIEWSNDSYLLLKLKSPAPTAPTTEILSEKWISFGQVLDFTKGYDFPVTLQVEVEPTFLGRFAGLLYSRPPLAMTLEFGGKKITKRFIPVMAREGFLLNPLLLNVNDVKSFYSGKMCKLDRLSFVIPVNAEHFYSDKIKLRISRAGL